MLDHLVKERTDVDLATVHCSSDVTPEYVINKINQVGVTQIICKKCL